MAELHVQRLTCSIRRNHYVCLVFEVAKRILSRFKTHTTINCGTSKSFGSQLFFKILLGGPEFSKHKHLHLRVTLFHALLCYGTDERVCLGILLLFHTDSRFFYQILKHFLF